MAEWTAAQRRAIESGARKIICSAAAGSGKTAVMIERIVRLLREGAEPESFLVVTFTNSAAAEMKEKIKTRLMEEREHPALRNALEKMNLMQVSTIHAFCQQLLRDYFHRVELDPSFQICDTSQRQTLFHEAFRETCDDLLQKEDPLYATFRQRFDSGKAEQILMSTERFLTSLPSPFRWMDEKIRDIPETRDFSHPWFSTLAKMAEDALYRAEISLSRMYAMFSDPFALDSYREAWKADAELFHMKQSALADRNGENPPSSFARLNTPRGLTVQESDWKDRYQKLRNDEFKKQIQKADALLLADPEKALEEWKNVRESLRALQRMMTETEERFRMKKKARGLADFQDLEQYALELLSDPLIQEEVHRTWRYVFVDECQDISAVQNEIVDRLFCEDNHLFMVGDIKQSIYRFRLADPELFLRRIRDARDRKTGIEEYIPLQTNFRSTPEILEATNMVFRSVMKEKVTEIGYGREDELIPGRKTAGAEPVHAVILGEGAGPEPKERTADFLREEILTLLQTPFPGKDRNYRYRDMVILMPAVQTDGPLLAGQLEERGIPVFFDGNGDYYQRQEIRMIRNLLEWIDDPNQDLPLISVMMQPPFSFTEEEMSQVRLNCPDREAPFWEAFRFCCEAESSLGEKCRQVMKKLREWQDLAEVSHVNELIWELYRDTGLYNILGVEPDGDIMQANLRMLAQQAFQAEQKGILTLRQFLSYMREQTSFGDQQSATLLGDQDDLVRIMTVHKSKGLQFPVVFCAGMDREPVKGDSGEIHFHNDLGICVNYKDPEHRISRPTLATEIFVWKKRREEMAEKVRLLYVAMTRAQERLYMLTCRETDPLWSMPESGGRILMAGSYTDWWMPVFLQDSRENLSTGCSQPEKPYEISTFELNQQKTVEKPTDIHNLGSWLESVISAPVVDDLWKNPEEEERSPTLIKRSVTALIQSARRKLEEEEEETVETKRMPDLLTRKLAGTELAESPAFMQREGQTTAASRGTLTHRVLSLMNLEKMRAGEDPEQVLREEKERMLRENMASEKELSQLRDGQIAAFWKSETGRRILRSPEVHREWNFNLLIRREQKMILQGVIDCAFREDGEWVILDYKTDRGKTPQQLKEEYSPQLQWYARAVAELTGEKVREAALYSLDLDLLIPVGPEDGHF